MKKTVLHLILFCILSPGLLAQAGGDRETGLKSQSPAGDHVYPLGYKPAPFRLRQMKRPAADARYKSAEALPAAFDLRTLGRVTPARDQGGGTYGGNCTSFATIGSVESRWLSMGFPATDLSEQNMAACNGFDEANWGYGQGANQFICSAYLTRLAGPVLESEDPYNLVVHFCRDYLNPVALVPESRWLPTGDYDLIKHTVYNYGAIYAGIYWDVTGASYRDTDHTYYYSGTQEANHAILVCGWDDNMVTAGGTGAWICKNSWGTGWGDNGFFYIAYQDTRFAQDEVAYYPIRWEDGEFDTAYVWDELGFTSILDVPNSSKVSELAKFTAAGPQLVTHVGICVAQSETVLNFHVYDDFSGGQLSGLLAEKEGIYAEYPGIYTFELPVPVNGDFYIEVDREVGDTIVSLPMETFNEGFSDPVINPDVNWYRRTWDEGWVPSDEVEWITGGVNFNLTIRAYADYGDRPVALFTADKQEACLGSEVTYTYLENNPASTFSWDFGEGASPSTANTQGPHQVTYSTEGTKTVTLVVSGAGGSDTLVRYDYVDVLPAIRVNIPKPALRVQEGRTVEITAYGADSYQWSPSNLVDNTTGQSVMATPPFTGNHMLWVTGTQGSCTATDSIELKTFPRPEYDDMCDALLINPVGWIGDFSNVYATSQSGEPAPDDVNCTSPLTWCIDGLGPTVTNSLWFCFYGSQSGNASIRTIGFDDQIAVYRADTCTEITKESLVAANDDYSPAELPAFLDNIFVEAGKKYFLQVDGSFGGVTGTFSLFYHDWPVGIEGPPAFDPAAVILQVYPNPGREVFNLKLDNAGSPEIEILVYSLNGKLVRRKSFSNVPGELFTRLDLGDQPAGIYHLRVIDGDRILDRKLVKQ